MGVKKKDFASLMTINMKDYAAEVNEQRAIPSVIDGLKPVQRRVLYWLSENKGAKDFLGCAQIVGGVLGKYHPHGDSSVYGALVRLSQPLILNYPLIDFHGNNGSLTDPPAAMRYTKAKLSDYGMALLEDINIPGVISWGKNYLETDDEPEYLLGSLGTLNLLVNPSLGIGVGMASNFTCHNIDDVKALVQYRMEHPNCSFEELPEIYPSFHNNGVLINKSDIPNIYKTGKGTIVLRAKYKWDGDCLIITEFPYRVDPSQIKQYLIKHPIEAITEMYEQNGQLKIYTTKTANKEKLLETLFKKTNLQMNYQVNMTATGLNGKPKVFNLMEILDIHISLQHNRLIKKAEYYKADAEHKLHIDEGIMAALDVIDEVIEIIKKSESTGEARVNLMNRLNIDEEQAQAILDIKLSRLARLEIDAIRQQIESYKQDIEEQTVIITSSERREEIHLAELSAYTDKVAHTECLDLITVGNSGNFVTGNFYCNLSNNLIKVEEDETDDMEEITIDDELFIITSEFRGIKRLAKDLVYGETPVNELVKLGKGETVVALYWRTNIPSDTFIATINGKDYRFSSDVITMSSTTRGKKLMAGKNLVLEKIRFGD